MFYTKRVLKNFAKFTRVTFFFKKVAGCRPANFLKKRLLHRCFSVNSAKILKIHLRTTASENYINSLISFYDFVFIKKRLQNSVFL